MSLTAAAAAEQAKHRCFEPFRISLLFCARACMSALARVGIALPASLPRDRVHAGSINTGAWFSAHAPSTLEYAE